MAAWETHEVLEEVSDIEDEWDIHEEHGGISINDIMTEIEDFADECVDGDEMELSSRAGAYGQRTPEDG